MKDNKVFVIALAIIAIILGGLLIYYFNMSNEGGFSFGGNSGFTTSGNSSSGGSQGSSGSSKEDFKTETITLGEVKDYQEFFNVDKLINYYYELSVEKKYGDVVNILDPSYIKQNKITASNVNRFVDTNFDDITFYATKMFVKGSGGIRYYFVQGDAQTYNFMEEILTEQENINYLVTIDYNFMTYSIIPLASSNDIFKVAQEYNISKNKEIKENDSNAYLQEKYDDEMIGTYYINYYKNMLYLNTKKAYSMLSSSTKAKYPELKDFTKDLPILYDKIITNLLSYGVKGIDARRTYSLIMSNNKEIIFIEKGIMNFEVIIN